MANPPDTNNPDFEWPDPRQNEEGKYDETPIAIDKLLENPPILPGESKAEFIRLHDEFWFPLMPESPQEHWLVWNSTTLTWEVMRYRRIKVAYLLNQRRKTVSALIRASFLSAAMRAIRKTGSDIDDNIERYFSDPDYQALIHKALEAAGYTADVIEAEMFARALPVLSQFEKLIASAEKRLTLFFREMDKIFGNRATLAREIATQQLDAGTE